jgi:hypothetical protein
VFADLVRQHRAAAAIQAAARGHAQRRRYRRALRGVVAIQVTARLPASPHLCLLPAVPTGCCALSISRLPACPIKQPIPACSVASRRWPGGATS